MLQVKLLVVGKLKEKYFRDCCAEYEKRLGRFVKLAVIEVPDERAPEKLSPAEVNQVMAKEGERLLSKIVQDDYFVPLCIDGKDYDSEGWAAELAGLQNRGVSRMAFAIGGSHGLSPDVLARADGKLSFSSFTFGHQMMRCIFLEQLYRAMKIGAGEAYHK